MSEFDRVFQRLFTLVDEIVTLYRQYQMINGSGELDTRLEVVPPHQVESNLKAFKESFDSTGPAMFVDVVLELYAKNRGFLHRGYQCDSWLRNDNTSLYYGVSLESAGNKMVNLDCVFLMLESLKRADSQFRSQAAVLRNKFSDNLYTIFVAALRHAQNVDGEKTVRGITPEVLIDDDIATMERLQTEILKDSPKPPAAASSAPGAATNPLSFLSQMFPGNLNDVVSSLLQSLPGVTKTITDTVARTTGQEISEMDQRMIDATISNISNIVRDPNSVSSLLSEARNTPDGISKIIERIITPSQETTSSVQPPSPAGPYLD